MSLTPNYNPNPLHPQIFISNQAGDIVYTFISKQLDPSGTQDFRLNGFTMELGLADNFGNALLSIHDHNNIFTDSTDNERSSVISREWGIEIYLGHTLATSYRAFYGKIKDVTVERPSTNLQTLTIACVGWGCNTKRKIIKIIQSSKETK